MVKGEGGESRRLTWSCEVLAVEPGRLPAPNRFRKSHGRERAPLPLLDTQTPTHVSDMCFLVTRICFLHRLRADGENVLEKTPVRSTPQKFSHMDTKAARYTMVLGEKW